MTYDSANERARQLPVPTQQQLVSYVTEQTKVLVPAVRRRGKPATLTTLHLCLGIVLCGLEGFGSQLKLWRCICLEPIGPFAPVWVVDQAIYNRLARAAGAMRAFFEQVSDWMGEQLVGLEERNLAPWAHQVLALDESTLDAVGRWLPELRAVLPATRAGFLGASAPCLMCDGNNGCAWNCGRRRWPIASSRRACSWRGCRRELCCFLIGAI
jgi:hypothetical protein